MFSNIVIDPRKCGFESSPSFISHCSIIVDICSAVNVRPIPMYFQGQPNPAVVWTQHKTAEGRLYYHNLITNQTSYEKPDELKTPTERLLSECPWKEYKTDDGKSYYHNASSKESVWLIPKELEELKNKLEAEQTENEKRPADTLSNQNEDSNLPLSSLASPLDQTPVSLQNDDSKSSASATPIASQPTPVKPDNKVLVETFRELMRDKNISSNASWEFALKSISSDPRYELFRHHPERKQMFNSYKTAKAKEEREEQRMKAKRARENLEKYLQSSPLVNPNLRYRQAVELFRENEYWKAVPESDRREIFEDVAKYLAEKEKKEAENLRRQNMTVLSDILDSMPTITYRTCWMDAQQLLLDNPAFASNTDLLNMDKEDALVIFIEHVRQLEQDEEEEKRNEKKRSLRQKRKNREKFEEFLGELHEQGKLTCLSKWCNLYQEISADPRFHLMITNFAGSSPLDLFKFYVDNLKRRYEEDKQVIKSILKERQFAVDCQTSYDDFLNALKENADRGGKLDANNVKMMYDKLFERAKEAEKERQRELSKSRRKLEMQFVSALSRVEPVIEESTAWEDIRFKVEHEPIFNEFTETERVQLFKYYIHSLEESCSHHHSKSRKQKRLKKSKHVHSSSSSISSGMELDRDESNEYETSSKRTKHHHHHSHKSRSHSGSVSSHRHSRSQSPLSYEKQREARKHQKHLDMVSGFVDLTVSICHLNRFLNSDRSLSRYPTITRTAPWRRTI